MSDCTKYLDLIKRSINEPLQKKDEEILNQHIAECSECAVKQKRADALKKALKKSVSKEINVPQDVKSSLHLRLVSESEKLKDKRTLFDRIFGFSGKEAGAISLYRTISYFTSFTAIVLVAAYFLTQNFVKETEKETMISQSEAQAGSPVTISLEYIAQKDISDATFTIKLQEGLAFYTEHEKIRQLKNHSWRGSLKKGSNTIPFVVKVEQKGTLTILTRADFEGFSHSHKIILESKDDKIKVTYFKLSDEKISEPRG